MSKHAAKTSSATHCTRISGSIAMLRCRTSLLGVTPARCAGRKQPRAADPPSLRHPGEATAAIGGTSAIHEASTNSNYRTYESSIIY